jgi:hypothetical protein
MFKATFIKIQICVITAHLNLFKKLGTVTTVVFHPARQETGKSFFEQTIAILFVKMVQKPGGWLVGSEKPSGTC